MNEFEALLGIRHSLSPQFKRINQFDQISLVGSTEPLFLVEYEYSQTAMATFPWKHQAIFDSMGNLIGALHAARHEFISIPPQQRPYLLTVIGTAKGNGGHQLFRIENGELRNVYDGYDDFLVKTFDNHRDQTVFDPPELAYSTSDINRDGYGDLVFSGTIKWLSGVTPDGREYDRGKRGKFTYDDPFAIIPIVYKFPFSPETGRFEATQHTKEMALCYPDKERVRPCSSDIIEALKDPILQRSFFHIRDSILTIQFPDSTIKWTENTDPQPWMLNEFLDKVDIYEFETTGRYSLSMDLGLASDGFQDSSTCKDEITLIHNRPGCRYSLWLNTSFFVEEHGCTEHTVVYFFTLNSAGIKNFRRDEAG